ncbi:Uncharacterised protein [uncultured archaeon]|nr:Uncharacterised protein [uncultured archaeon]
MDIELKWLLNESGVVYDIVNYELSENRKATDEGIEEAINAILEEESNLLEVLLLENNHNRYLGAIIQRGSVLDFSKIEHILKAEGLFMNYEFAIADAGAVKNLLGYKTPNRISPFAFYMGDIPALVDSTLLVKDSMCIVDSDENILTKFRLSPREFSNFGYLFGDICETHNSKPTSEY